MGTNQDVKNFSLLPIERSHLMDADKLVGAISFTTPEKVQLMKLVESPVWEVLKSVYAKQRLVQIAVATVNHGQEKEDLFFYKGKSIESNHMIKEIELTVRNFRADEKKKKDEK